MDPHHNLIREGMFSTATHVFLGSSDLVHIYNLTEHAKR